MNTLKTCLRSFLHDETGATMVEYALMVALIAVACIGAVSGVATALNTNFNTVSTSI
jgi:pilus assembly protein Flp/PilA